MIGLSIEETVERIAALERRSLNLLVERRRDRPAGVPTRLQAHVLLAARERGALPVSEVALLLEIAPATASQLLTAIEERGWLQRGIVAHDRRRHEVTVTPAGLQVLQQVEERRRARLARLLTELSAQEREQLVGLAERLAGLLSRSWTEDEEDL